MVSFSSPQTSVGGIERYLDTTLKEMDKKGVKVHLVSVSYGKDEVEEKGNITFHRLKALNRRTRKKNLSAKKLIIYLKKLIKKEKIDIIIAENFQRGIHPAYSFAVNIVSMETKTPLVLRMHAHTTTELEKSLTRDLFWKKIMPVSKSVSSEVYNFGVDVSKLCTVYPPIDTETFHPGLGKEWLRSRINVGSNDIIILHASRITGSKRNSYLESKGIITLIKAFSIVAPHHKNLKLLIATALPPPTWEKEYEKEYKKIFEIAELNGVKEKIIVRPFKLEEMPHVYNGVDIFVMASQMESFGLVYGEALSCGIPVIGTSVGGIPEIIDNAKTGYLTEPNNPVELSKRIELLLNNEKRRKLMGNRGRKAIEKKFNARKITENLLGIFESIIGSKKKSSENKKNYSRGSSTPLPVF